MWGERMAEILVAQHWESITRLSFALLEHDRLSGEQVRETLVLRA
jgi:hypothetical protein